MRITDLRAPEITYYTGLNEKQAKRIFEPEEGVFICESIRVIERAIAAGYKPMSFFVEEGMADNISALAAHEDVPVYAAPYDVMKDIIGYSLTGGVLCAMRRRPLPEIRQFISSHERIVVLDDVENPTNVGAIFRSAAALGADGIILTKGSADPLYRRAARVSMGCVFQIPWTYAKEDFMPYLKEAGFETFALALSDEAVSIKNCANHNEKSAVILGNEDHGISEEILSACDKTVMIPMKRGVDSLNVAAASAIAFWTLLN